MSYEPTELERNVRELTGTFAESLNKLATGDFIREGVLKEAITSLIWDVFHTLPDQRAALAEALENWPEIIRDAAVEARQKAMQEDA